MKLNNFLLKFKSKKNLLISLVILIAFASIIFFSPYSKYLLGDFNQPDPADIKDIIITEMSETSFSGLVPSEINGIRINGNALEVVDNTFTTNNLPLQEGNLREIYIEGFSSEDTLYRHNITGNFCKETADLICDYKSDINDFNYLVSNWEALGGARALQLVNLNYNRCINPLNSNIYTVYDIPSIPSNITGEESNTEIVLNWRTSINAFKYHISKTQINNGEETIYHVDVKNEDTSINFIDTNVTTDETYSYKIQAENCNNISEYSNPIVLTARTSLDSPVLLGTTGNGSVSLNWDEVTDATSYEIYKLILSTPQNLRGTVNTSNTSIDLTWDGIVDADTYNIYRKEYEEGGYQSNIWTNITGTTSVPEYSDKNIELGIKYLYAITAYEQDLGESDYAETENPLFIPLPILGPDNVLVRKIDDHEIDIQISWTKVTDAEKYIIYRKESEAEKFDILIELTDKDLHHIDTDAKELTDYIYGVAAVNQKEEISKITISNEIFKAKVVNVAPKANDDGKDKAFIADISKTLILSLKDDIFINDTDDENLIYGYTEEPKTFSDYIHLDYENLPQITNKGADIMVYYNEAKNEIELHIVNATVLGEDYFDYTISDDYLVSSARVYLDFTTDNQAPEANEDIASTTINTPITIDALINDIDINGDTLSIISVNNPNNGSTEIIEDKILYTPEKDFVGENIFEYTITDGKLEDSARITVTVEDSNSEPTAKNDNLTTDEDISVQANIIANDTDPDGNTLSIKKISSSSKNGIVTILNDTEIKYEPNNNYNGTDSFKYIVTDGELNSEATVNITIISINDSPIANNNTIETTKNTAITTDIVANDTDPDGDNLIISRTSSSPKNGTVSILNDTEIKYEPNKDYTGTDSFTYIITDGELESEATVNITITKPLISFNFISKVLANDNLVKIGETTNLNITIENLINGKEYRLYVKAINNEASSNLSNELRLTPLNTSTPEIIDTLSIDLIPDDNDLLFPGLEWQEDESDNRDIYYKVYQAITSDNPDNPRNYNYYLVGQTTVSQTNFMINTDYEGNEFVSDNDYNFSITSVNDIYGESDYSNIQTITHYPVTLRDSDINYGARGINLNWDGPDTHYRIYVNDFPNEINMNSNTSYRTNGPDYEILPNGTVEITPIAFTFKVESLRVGNSSFPNPRISNEITINIGDNLITEANDYGEITATGEWYETNNNTYKYRADWNPAPYHYGFNNEFSTFRFQVWLRNNEAEAPYNEFHPVVTYLGDTVPMSPTNNFYDTVKDFDFKIVATSGGIWTEAPISQFSNIVHPVLEE